MIDDKVFADSLEVNQVIIIEIFELLSYNLLFIPIPSTIVESAKLMCWRIFPMLLEHPYWSDDIDLRCLDYYWAQLIFTNCRRTHSRHTVSGNTQKASHRIYDLYMPIS